MLITAVLKLHPELLDPTYVPPPNHAPTARMRRAARSFKVLTDVWQTDLCHDPTAAPAWSSFEKLRDLRHVLVHRLGLWQPQLDPKPTLEDRLRSAGMQPNGYSGPIPLHPDELDRSIGTALALLTDLE